MRHVLLELPSNILNVSIVSGERPIFVRERLSRSYSTSSYFWAKAAAELPLLALQPTVMVAITYFAAPLDRTPAKFFILCKLLLSKSF